MEAATGEAVKPRISYSDVMAFLRCRRQWDFSSRLRQHLEPIEKDSVALWFGTGFHYALESWYRQTARNPEFDTALAPLAFGRYIEATQETGEAPSGLGPSDFNDHYTLARGMLLHYLRDWQYIREPLYTAHDANGAPMVEVPFEIVFPSFILHGTIDRIVTDLMGRYWIEDSKTAKAIETTKLTTDYQCTVYMLAGMSFMGDQLSGVKYTQFKKAVPKPPRTLKSGKLSTDKSQQTTYALAYREGISVYGSYAGFPPEYADYLAHLQAWEIPESDGFVRRDTVYRSRAWLENSARDLERIAVDMLNLDTVIYPSYTRECPRMCDFYSACYQLQDGGDYQSTIVSEYRAQAASTRAQWRTAIVS